MTKTAMTKSAAPAGSEATYAHSPRPAGMPVSFTIKGRKLVIDRMAQTIDVPLAEVVEMRVTYEPSSFAQSQLRTRLRLRNGPPVTLSSVSFRSVVFADRQDAQYGAFVRNLAQAVARANPDARFAAGRPLPFWLAMIWSALVIMAAIVLFIVYALGEGETTAAGIGVVVAAIGVWQLEPLIRLNRPQLFSPDAPPAALVPQPKA
ncbi:MAG TPA: hypothetical protein VLQ65_14375 [Saliniramus sp.]|nr:hypothetical protein [Saliniramus sp.]